MSQDNSSGSFMGKSLPRVEGVRSACCKAPINRTLQELFGSAPKPGRETRPCPGCDGGMEVTEWCSTCGKEEPERVAGPGPYSPVRP